MSKTVLWAFVVIILSSLGGSAYYFFSNDAKKSYEANNCVFEVKTCSDGTNVTRVGKDCNFALCPNEVITEATTTEENLTEISVSTSSVDTSTLPSVTAPIIQNTPPPLTESNEEKPSAVSAIVSYVSSFFQSAGDALGNVASTVQSTFSNSNENQNTQPASNLVSERYFIEDGNIVSGSGSVIYTIPQSVIDSLGTTTEGWTNTPINVVPVGDVAPVVNGIPVDGAPGKYYLSENSFGNIELCEFSNKIYIFDSVTNEVTLMYEENSETLPKDDPRACNSEIILLATENNNLILKYHTINTSTLCDSSWSEPDKTWYLNVTNLLEGMKRYYIPNSLYLAAEQEEEVCRAGLEQ